MAFHMLSAHQSPSKKRSTLKGKNLLPMGANFFPFRVDPFQKGGKNFASITSHEIVSSP